MAWATANGTITPYALDFAAGRATARPFWLTRKAATKYHYNLWIIQGGYLQQQLGFERHHFVDKLVAGITAAAYSGNPGY